MYVFYEATRILFVHKENKIMTLFMRRGTFAIGGGFWRGIEKLSLFLFSLHTKSILIAKVR